MLLDESHKHILLCFKSCSLETEVKKRLLISFEELGNPTSHISKFFVQNVLFSTPKINWISLIKNPMLVCFLVIPPLARLIEYIIIENSVLRNPCRI
jgi:hypothetical protein